MASTSLAGVAVVASVVLSASLSVCVNFCALNRKWIELPTLKSVEM